MRRGWLGGCAAALVWAAPAWPASAWAAPVMCAHETPKSGEWRVVHGFGIGPTKAEAMTAAMEHARANLRAQLEAAGDEDGLKKLLAALNFTTYAKPEHWDPVTREACVLGIVADVDLEATRRAHVKALKERLGTLTKEVVGKLPKGHHLWVALPEWYAAPSGDPPRGLRNLVVSHLVGAGLRERNPSHVLRGEVTAAGDTCRWVPLLHDTRKGVDVPLGEVEFNPQALGLRACMAASPERAFFPRPRSGVGGLRVTLTTSIGTTTPCPGQPFHIEVHTNQPARVRLYTVNSDGRSMLVMPERVVNGHEQVTHPTMPAQYNHFGAGVLVGLFAVALPEGEPFPTLGIDRPECLGTNGLPWQLLPGTAAIDGSALPVKAPGSSGCSLLPEHRVRYDEEIKRLNALPRCGLD